MEKRRGSNRHLVVFFAFWLLACLLSGCVSLPDPKVAQIGNTHPLATLSNSPGGADMAGQTFVPRRNGLDSLTLWLAAGDPEQTPDITFLFSLFSGPEPTDHLIYRAPFRLPAPNFKGPFRITFPAQDNSAGQIYYIQLQPLSGSLKVMGRAGESYTEGQAQVAGEWIRADLAFSMTYQYNLAAAREDLERIARALWMILPLGIILLLPGWLLTYRFCAHSQRSIWEQAALAVGMSLAINPLVMLWTRIIGLRWSKTGSYVFAGLLILITLIVIARSKPWSAKIVIRSDDLAFSAILAVSLFVRVAMARDLVASPWVDSVHHAWITRLIQEQGGIPFSYQPTLDIPPTSYHPGFHVSLALFQWLSGLAMPKAMLIFGQALNVASILAVYLFTISLTRHAWASILSALAAGLFMPLPAYLTSWGRYTHLAGLLILVAIIALQRKPATPILQPEKQNNIDAHESDFPSWQKNPFSTSTLILNGIGVAGLFLVHYRVAAFLGFWWLAEILSSSIDLNDFLRKNWAVIKRISLGFLLILPWALPAIFHTFLPRLPSPPGDRAQWFEGFDLSVLTAASGWGVLVAAGLGVIFFSLQSTRKSLALIIWVGLMALSANLGALGLPGSRFINNLSVEITLFLPISLFAGFGAAWLIERITLKMPQPVQKMAIYPCSLALVLGMFLGFIRLLPILNPTTVLVHNADLTALEWIARNIPQGEHFLINPYRWGYGLCTGSDGGYWITPLTGHLSIPPPVLYGFEAPEEVQKIKTICEEVRSSAQNPTALSLLMRENGIRYLYLGHKGGVMSPDLLQSSESFELIYSNQGVWIFKRIDG